MTDTTPLLWAALAMILATLVVFVVQFVRSRRGGKPDERPWWGPRDDDRQPPQQ